MREVVARARPDVALANHLVMGPAILARALDDVPYAVKVHGSALEYIVKPHPRFRPYAAEGLRGRARRARRLAPHRREPVGRDGGPDAAGAHAARAARRGRGALRAARAGRRCGGARALRERLAALAPVAATGSSFDRDPREAVAALDAVEPGDRLVVFVGKLIASKGVELLLAAWPLVLAREPRARLMIVGFGAFREGLEGLAAALAAGDLTPRAAIARPRTGARCRSSPRSWTGSRTTRRCALRPRARSPGGWTTTSWPTCCPPPRRWR